ncbi:MAG: histidine ammonia-lyase [Proteobacteria bacterium]|nr:histidine ammonia-lyase [Pseudomonadota bacterium]
MAQAVRIDGKALSIEQVERVARHNARVKLTQQALCSLRGAHDTLLGVLGSGQVIYGVNTGFGSLARERIDARQLREVQHNLIRSHAAGVGAALPPDSVRAMWLLLAAALARGHSGVRPEVAEAIVALLNADVTPLVPEIGSVGASGDLAPLAHAALVLLGEGEATLGGRRLSGSEALAAAGIAPLSLQAKEGLALLNGTHLMAAEGALLLSDCERLVDAALAAAAMSIDACRGTDAFLDDRVQVARGQRGQREVAHRLRRLIDGSQIVPSHQDGDPRVQDPYSLRCSPQVMGSVVDALSFVRGVFERELGAATDNPLVFAPDPVYARSIVSAGNFHGLPLALALDTLAIALSHLAGIAERRVYYMLAASDTENPLNTHLSPMPGLHSGLMIAQYTAAACCNELVGLATPASVANLPTSAGMEDYNSFGPYAARKARRGLALATSVVAIELLCASEALEYQRPLRSGHGVERAHALVREVVDRRTRDRPPAPDVEAIARLVRSGRFRELVNDR